MDGFWGSNTKRALQQYLNSCYQLGGDTISVLSVFISLLADNNH